MGKSIAVFGLGRFGGTLVKELAKLGMNVLAVDTDETKVNFYAEYATHCIVTNGYDENTLKQLGINNMDVCIVSFGENIESSILTSLILKELGAPQVWAKAANQYHAKVLERIGIDRVIQPERDMAIRVAHHIGSKKIVDYIELSKDYSIAEIIASEKLHNKSIIDLKLRSKYGCTIIAIQRGNNMMISPDPHEIIQKGDLLIIIGRTVDIERFDKKRL